MYLLRHVRLGKYQLSPLPDLRVSCLQFIYRRLQKELTDAERDIITNHFKGLLQAGGGGHRFFPLDLPDRPPLFIKHNDDVLSEAYTQHFFYGLAAGNESAPRVPKVIDAFSGDGYCLMVMEKIEARTLSAGGISEDEAVESTLLHRCRVASRPGI